MVVPPCVGFEAFKDTTGPIVFTEKSLHYWGLAFFRVLRSPDRRLYLLWIVPIFWQMLGGGLSLICEGAFLASVVWRVSLAFAMLCILSSGWLFLVFRRAGDWHKYRKIVLPGLALQVALLVSALVYGFRSYAVAARVMVGWAR